MNAGFDTPVRIHWLLPRGGDAAVAAALREARPLALALEAERAQDLSCLDLPWEGTMVTWIFTGWRARAAAAPPGVGRVELPAADAPEAEEAFARFPAREGGALMALRVVPAPAVLRDLPRLLAGAAERGWGMTIAQTPAPAAARPAFDRARARAAADSLASLGPGRLVVHDFFLSEALGLAPREAAGCEAGDALAFVDREGNVFACASLPVLLGNVPGLPLAAAWAGDARSRLRAALARLPAPCSPCPDLARCRGGCRGLARQAHGDLAHADPGCPHAKGAR
jgi:radical SAM protein with 4Fe4S-binding SPASM domain